MLSILKSCRFFRHRPTIKRIIHVSSLLFLTLILTIGYFSKSTNIYHIAQSSDISPAIDLATNYLLRSCDFDGRFLYRIWPDSKKKPKPLYNILRHSGTMYALAQAYQRQPSQKIKIVLSKTSRYLQSHCLKPLPDHETILGIWSLPSVNRKQSPPQIKLGGVGLGLVALVSVEKIIPGTISLTNLRKLGQFLIYMQKPDGSFYSKYIEEEGGRIDRWTSLYYPGEAALGLLMLYEVDPLSEWLQAATRALEHLIKQRPVETGDQWLLIACAKLLSLNNYPQNIVSRETIIKHTKLYCQSVMQEQILHDANIKFIGGFNREGRTTPTATRVEGLAAALEIIGDSDQSFRRTIYSSIEPALNFLIRTQITEGNNSGGIPRAICQLPGQHEFNRRAGEIRIDYVQHALSAMIQCEYF